MSVVDAHAMAESTSATLHAQMRRFRQISDVRSLGVIAFDLLAIISLATIAVRIGHPAITIAAIVLIAGRQMALRNLIHAAAHYSLFSRKAWNDRLEFLFAYWVFDSVLVYREPHLEHHLDFARAIPERFDYLLDDLGLAGTSIGRRTWIVFIRPFLGYGGFGLVRTIIDDALENREFAAKVIIFWSAVLVIFGVQGWLGHLLLFWFVPLFFVYPAFHLWAELSDHYQVANGNARNQVGLFNDALLKGHELYHDVHHRFPYIPFYRLPQAHAYLTSIGDRTEMTSGFADFLRFVFRGSPAGSAVIFLNAVHHS